MELIKKFPKGFFEEKYESAKVSNNPDDEIIRIKWSKKVENGKKIALVKKGKRH